MDKTTDFDDPTVKLATHNDVGQPLVAAAMCGKCHRIQPLSCFQRFMTTAEAKYRGYSGERKILIETAHCKDCRPRIRRNIEAFATFELKRKARKGEVSQLMVDMVEKERKREALAKQRHSQTARWGKVWAAAWAPIMDALKKELHDARMQRRYARSKGGRPLVQAFVDGYCAVLVKLRADLTLAQRRRLAAPEHERWQDYLSAAEKDAIAALWNGVEYEYREAGMRRPHAFANRFGDIFVPEGTVRNSPPEES